MTKIFYSWQSDIEANRSYLTACLDAAARQVDGFEIETATRDPRGAVDIAQAILTKIEESHLFLADISIINPDAPEGTRQTPNPNVLYELGYAIGKKGEASIVLVANADTTATSKLPFDIRNRLIILRKFDDANKQPLTNELAGILRSYQAVPETMTGPYIYLELDMYSSNFIKFRAKNDEDVDYFLETIDIAGSTATIRKSLQAKQTTRNLHLSAGMPPYSEPFPDISFVVSRMNEKYRIYQRVYLESRADGQYNLNSIESTPYKIVRL